MFGSRHRKIRIQNEIGKKPAAGESVSKYEYKAVVYV
jgi:hypothetical protein